MGIAKPQVEGFSCSHEIVDLATQWLSDCDKGHNFCRSAIWNPKLPSKLLEIKPDSIGLRDTSGIPNQTKYATLSHCWGPNSVDFKLMKDSLVDFQTSIRQEWLLKTFQDAISIARRLVLEYLWIDSLCILQDDLED
ncbi:HET-domain-containing protein [Acephala macrosclerotiorum]|nr:HET-domain-containing protein [Acephala macrosclerotiorum]